MAEVLPLFPLSHVLLPGMPLPLHIFEQRYRDLLSDLAGAPAGARFGVVALRTGTEAVTAHTRHAAPDVERIGTVAEILEVELNDDGTSDLLAVGSQRFAISSLLTEGKPYLRGEVTYLDEDGGPADAEPERIVRGLMTAYDTLLTRIAGRATGGELPSDATQLSYEIAARLPLPPHERQALLCDATTADRLARLYRLLRRETALLQRTRTIAVSPAVLRLLTGAN